MAKKSARTNTSAQADALTTIEAQDLALLQDTSAVVVEFLQRAGAWLQECKALDAQATVALARAKAMPKPTDAASDELAQRYIRSTADELKALEAKHGELVDPVNKLHKFLTARRKASADKLVEAKGIYQTHHNTYVREEQRRVEAENERRRLEAEAQERERRRQEQERLEAEALAAEEQLEGLSAREQAFVDAYLTTRDGIRAAKIAGYADPAKQGPRLVASAKVRKAVEAAAVAQKARERKAEVEQAPLDVTFEEATADISRAPGASDRTLKSCRIVNPEQFRAAVILGQHGIPHDTLEPAQTVLNTYARRLGKVINGWPGVELVEKPITV